MTVLIPTFNRRQLVIDRLPNLSPDFEYLFLNGSVDAYGINDSYENVNEEHYPGLSPDERIKVGLHKVLTPYVIMMSDDDLLVVENYDAFEEQISTTAGILLPQTWYKKKKVQWIPCSRQFIYRILFNFGVHVTKALIKSGVVVWSAVFPTHLLRDEFAKILDTGRCEGTDIFVVKEVEYLMAIALCKSERPIKITGALLLLRDKSDRAEELRREHIFSFSGWMLHVRAFRSFLKDTESSRSDADRKAIEREEQRVSLAFEKISGRSSNDFSSVLMEPRAAPSLKPLLLIYHLYKYLAAPFRVKKINLMWKI